MSQRQDPRERINILKRLIMNNEVESQDYLIKNLEKMGHTVTQGTLSRDLKKLNASKVRRGERYIYILFPNTLFTNAFPNHRAKTSCCATTTR